MTSVREHLNAGQVIPAHPLALDAHRRLDERHQRALTRYYIAAGAGGIAVGVHTTQFSIREHGLYRPVLELAAETAREALAAEPGQPFVRVAGLVGRTAQAIREAEVAVALGYDVGLLSLGAWADDAESAILRHCAQVAEVIPLFGFYLQPAVGGRVLSHGFWRELAELPNLWAIKIAPFNRYYTLDVVRAVAAAGRDDVALYTGNDDTILADLLTPFRVRAAGRVVERRIAGGLLGHWAVWTRSAVRLLRAIQALPAAGGPTEEWLARAAAIIDMNAAIFDPHHDFAGCIPGIHEVLRRQGLLRGTWCLDLRETLSPGQSDEIDRVTREYAEYTDDEWVAENLEGWLR
ncbi:MAG TPA: dihydrodipicolinate synthase family protein [Gemmatimonadaceae bacterium]|nr:dihydrodipicolinate synthase family protein [Gemmatimonadaceae bacterium]